MSGLITANGVNVVTGTISMQLIGVWIADLVLDQPDGTGFDAGTSVKIDAGGMTLSGVVAPARTGDFLDAVHVRILGGKGGMAKPATPRSFVQPGAYVRDVLNALATASGESLSSSIAASLTGTNLTAWAIMQGPVSQALETLLEVVSPGANWRILADGSLWVGQETWPTQTVDFDGITQDPADQSYDLGVESFSITPGVTIDGIGKVDRVEHTVESGRVRTVVWAQAEGPRGSAAAIQAMIAAANHYIDYYALYDAKVISQSGDGSTVDLIPTDPRLPKMGSVPLKLGIPGAVAKFSPNAVVRLGWNNGDPSKPFACLFDQGASVTSLTIKAATVYLGDDTGTDSLVKLSEFNNHTHSVPGTGTTCVNGSAWTGTATTAKPAAATGTTNVQGK